MLEIILIIVAVAIVGVLVLAALQPSAFRVERSALVKAPPEKVYPLISNLHNFNSWNPFMKMEPDAKVIYSGASEGKGAAYTWEGAKMGSGRMEITEAAAPSKIRARLEFYKPFAATNVAEFTVDGSGNASNVTWAMSGQKSFVPKLMGLFVSMDKMIGSSFEQGLAELKAKAEV